MCDNYMRAGNVVHDRLRLILVLFLLKFCFANNPLFAFLYKSAVNYDPSSEI